MLSCVPVLYFVGVADYGAALMEQQAHHGKHTALDQYSKQPVPRYQVAACQAGQQGGDRHADADSRKELFRLHVGVSGGIGNDAVGQPRCDKRQNGICLLYTSPSPRDS